MDQLGWRDLCECGLGGIYTETRLCGQMYIVRTTHPAKYLCWSVLISPVGSTIARRSNVRIKDMNCVGWRWICENASFVLILPVGSTIAQRSNVRIKDICGMKVDLWECELCGIYSETRQPLHNLLSPHRALKTQNITNLQTDTKSSLP